MALCLRPQVIWVPFTNVSTPRNQITVYIPDAGTPTQNCQFMLVAESDYKDHGLKIDNADDAMVIAGAFIALIATMGAFRYLAKSIWEASEPSDEKH